ncbi:MAG: AzlD domain-containing protein [Giesbergeria sp.]
MTLWLAILVGAAVTYLTKLSGYAVPARWLNNPRMTRVAGSITVALLSALIVMNTFASGAGLVLDARLAALAVAALALWVRLPFLMVVVLGAVGAGAVRALG